MTFFFLLGTYNNIDREDECWNTHPVYEYMFDKSELRTFTKEKYQFTRRVLTTNNNIPSKWVHWSS